VSQFSTSRRRLISGLAAKAPLRPPWTIDELDFVERCTACGDCVVACPEQILRIDARNQPVIDFSQGECTFCQRCASACKHNVYKDPERDDAWLYQAVINEQCLAYQQVVCQSCGDACEQSAIHFALSQGMVSQPQVDTDSCTGCGACVSVCPVQAIEIRA